MSALSIYKKLQEAVKNYRDKKITLMELRAIIEKLNTNVFGIKIDPDFMFDSESSFTEEDSSYDEYHGEYYDQV